MRTRHQILGIKLSILASSRFLIRIVPSFLLDAASAYVIFYIHLSFSRVPSFRMIFSTFVNLCLPASSFTFNGILLGRGHSALQ